MTLRDQLCEAHTLACNEHRHEDIVALLRAIWALDGKPLPTRQRDMRDDDQKDRDEYLEEMGYTPTEAKELNL